MPRLFRPHIPLEVRCRVALRQLGHALPDEVLDVWPNKKQLLDSLLNQIAAYVPCRVADLRLDHDPPLAARPQMRAGLGRTKYVPDANDPDHLFYRPHGPEFASSHLIKTNVRGDHGQHPDRVLIKRARKKCRRRPKVKIRSRGFRKAAKRRRRRLPLPPRRTA